VIRKAFVMSVHPGQEAEYERRHHGIWHELTATLRANGVCNYSIFLDTSTRALFGYAEVESEEHWQAVAATDVCRRWWRYMADVMPTNPDSSPVAREMREVFHIG
jgi:L-rhamnose mutarotase